MPNRFAWNSQVYENIAMVQKLAGIELLEKVCVLGPERFARDPLAKVTSILDIGCGTGVLAVYLAKRLTHGQVLGVDVSPAMVSRAREFAKLENVANLRIEEMDAERMPFSEEFDLIISNAAFHWIRNAGKLLDSVSRALRPHGLLAVQFPLLNERHPMVATMARAIQGAGLAARFATWQFPWFRTTGEAYSQLLQAKGFEHVTVDQGEDELFLSLEEFLAFFNAVGLPLYFAGLTDEESTRLSQACENEAKTLLKELGNMVRFIRLFALARKPGKA